MAELQHKFVNTNGIRMHYVEQGSGPLVVLCHGWPESWYSWRHQIPALAAAGFRVVAPDQRGYGQTDAPAPIESYNILNLVGDIVGLVNSLGVESAVIVGHDWGAPVAWNSALLRPDIFRAIALLSVPYFPRTPMRPTDGMKALAGDQHFYQLYFQEPGKVEKELDADPRRSMAMILYSASGDVPRTGEFSFLFPKTKKFIETGIAARQAAGVADGSRPRFLCRRVQARRLSRRRQLVSQLRSQLGADAFSRRRETATARRIRRR